MAVKEILFFPNYDTFLYTVDLLEELEDVFNVDLVCKPWQEALTCLKIWDRIHRDLGIPFIEGKERKLRADLKKLHKITLGVEKIEKYIGEFEGEIPCIRLDIFNMLFQSDPDEPDKKMGQTYEFIVIPEAIFRTLKRNLSASVDAEGKLSIEELADQISREKRLRIPLSFSNLVKLSRHPLEGGANGNVFSNLLQSNIMRQCCSSSSKVKIFLMRRESLLTCDQQKAFKNRGSQHVPLLVRALSNMIKILESNDCPDRGKPLRIFARTSDKVRYSSDFTRQACCLFCGYRGL